MVRRVFVKIGGSFITHKDKPASLNYSALVSLKNIFSKILSHNDLRIVAGNGGGSFAHYAVTKYSMVSEDLLLVKCHEATRLLNRIVVDYLIENGIPATSVQTSAIIYYDDVSGVFDVFYRPIEVLLEKGLIPVVYGECIPTAGKPLVLSTENIFGLIAKYIKPERIVLLTDVDGVYTCDPKRCTNAVLIKKITSNNINDVLETLKQYSNVDVTGGMFGKVVSMSKLAKELGIEILVVSGFDIDSAIVAITGGYPERSTLIAP